MTTVTKLTRFAAQTLCTINKLYEEDSYVILGAGGDINEWIEGYSGLMKEAGIGVPEEFFYTTGGVMNRAFGITADKFPPSLGILIFSLDGLDLGKLAIFRLRMEDRWMKDLIDNTHAREPKAAYQKEDAMSFKVIIRECGGQYRE